MNTQHRKQLINWLLLVMWLHLVIGLITTWAANSTVFAAYHQTVMLAFGVAGDESEPAQAIHIWWLELFGATFQAFSAVMLILIYLMKNTYSTKVWGFLALTILLWAAQDLFVSARVNLILHYWVDVTAVVLLVIPIVYLAYLDAKHVDKP